MTDERYAFVEDVKNRKNIVKSGGKKGKSKYKCTLPSDYMTTKEKHAANSQWVSITYDRPISFDKFLAYSDEDKKIYLQNVIDNHGGNTNRIAKMLGCTEAKVKQFRQDLHIMNPIYTYANADIDSLWNKFMENDNFLRKPMSYEDFKTLDWYDQMRYIRFLNETMGSTLTKISIELFKRTKEALRLYLDRHNIAYTNRGKGYRMSKEQTKAWEEWLEKDEEPEHKTEEAYIPMDTSDEEVKTVEEPEETESYAIPSMQVHLRIDSQDQIIEIFSKLPKAKKGQIMFIWGKEESNEKEETRT